MLNKSPFPSKFVVHCYCIEFNQCAEMSLSSVFSLCSQIQLPTPKFLSHNIQPSVNCQFISSRMNYKLLPVQFQIPTFPSLFTKCFHFSFTYNPHFLKLSDLHTRRSSPSQSNLSKFFIEYFVSLLVGSFIFMGCFNVRCAMAMPAQINTANLNLDEKHNTGGKGREEEMSEKILEHEPGNIDTLKVVLYGKIRSGKIEESIKYVHRLIDLEPDEVEWRLLLALCHEMMGQLDKAKRLFMDILEERPLLVRALHGLALVMHKNHEGQSVFEMLNKALGIARREKQVTEERNIRILIAQMHVVKGELEEGLKKFQDLVDENPRDFRPFLCQGIIYSLLGKKKKGAEQFKTYQALVPDEFPQREFIDDIVMAAKTASAEQFQKEFDAEFSFKK